MRDVLRIRDARLYLGGQALSLFGDSALVLVLGIWAKELTESTAAAGLVILAVVAPATLLAPFSGLLVDRVRRRPLLVATNLGTGLAVLPLLFVHDAADVWLLYVVAVVYGCSYTVIGAGQSALLVTVVPDALLPAANGLLQTAREGLRLVAPLAGAALYAAFGGSAVAILDAATFFIAAAALLAMRVREPKPEPSGERRLEAVAAGTRHIARSRALRRLTAATAIAMLGFGLSETVYFEIVEHGLGRPAAFLGVVLCAQGVGAVLGGICAARLLDRWGETGLVAAGMGAFAAGCLICTTDLLVPVLAGTALVGASLPWIVVGQATLLQRRTPLAMQGRAWAAVELLTGTPQTLAIAAGAALVTFVDHRLLLAAEAVLIATAGAYLVGGLRGVRARRHAVRPTG